MSDQSSISSDLGAPYGASTAIGVVPPAQPVPVDKKRAKFEEIAVARTKRAIKAIRVLAGMGGKNRYSYSFDSADIEKIASTLELEVAQLRTVMVAPGRQMDIEFYL